MLSGRLDMRGDAVARLSDASHITLAMHTRSRRDCMRNPVLLLLHGILFLLNSKDVMKIDMIAATGHVCRIEETFLSPISRSPTCPGRPRPGPSLVPAWHGGYHPVKYKTEASHSPNRRRGNRFGRRAGLCGCVYMKYMKCVVM